MDFFELRSATKFIYLDLQHTITSNNCTFKSSSLYLPVFSVMEVRLEI